MAVVAAVLAAGLTVVDAIVAVPPAAVAEPPEEPSDPPIIHPLIRERAAPATVRISVGSDRVGTSSAETPLAGAVLRLADSQTGAFRTDSWATCTSDASGLCVFTIPIGNNSAAGELQSGSYLWVRQQSAPAGYFMNTTFGTGSTGAVNTTYSLPTPRLLSGGIYTSGTAYTGTSQPAATFMTQTGHTDTTARSSSGTWQVSRDNPDPLLACGVDVGIVIDLSASVNPYIGDLRSAARQAVQALVGTPSRVALFTFGTNAPRNAGENLPLTPVSTQAGADTVIAKINSYQAQTNQATNWDMGLAQVGAGFDIVIVLTDGNPTRSESGAVGPGNSTRFKEIENGIFAANRIKAGMNAGGTVGQRIIAIGVGDALSGNPVNLAAISGPDAYDPQNPTDPFDYVVTADYNAAATVMAALARAECPGTVSIVKKVIRPGGTIADAAVAGNWTFDASVAAGSLDRPAGTTEDGTGAVNFAIDYPVGVSTTQFTATERPIAGFTHVPIDGANAVCTDLDNHAQPVINAPGGGFTVAVDQTDALTCTVYNQAPPLGAAMSVEKLWSINGSVPISNGNQPAGLSAALEIDGAAHDWTVPLGQLTADSTHTVAETRVDSLPLCEFDRATFGRKGQTPAAFTGEADVTLQAGTNEFQIVNYYECETRLTLVKQVPASSPAQASDWTVAATIGSSSSTNPHPPGAIPGFSGPGSVTGHVTPTVEYLLSESGGNPLYVPAGWDSDSISPGAVGSWDCAFLDAGGGVEATTTDGADGDVSVGLGEHMRCTIVNSTATITMRKIVENTHGGGAAPEAFQLMAVPVGPLPLPDGVDTVSVTGSATGQSASLRPGIVYELQESGPPGYGARTITCDIGENGAHVPLTRFVMTETATIGCTFTNQDAAATIIITKEAVGFGDAVRPYGFTGTWAGAGAFTIDAPGNGTLTSTRFENIAPGRYTVTEDTDEESDLTALSCNVQGEDVIFDTGEREATFDLVSGDTVECFFTNAAHGTIHVIKLTDPFNHPSDFPFEISGPGVAPERFVLRGTPTQATSFARSGLGAGTYVVQELLDEIPGWSIADGHIKCGTITNGGWVPDEAAGTVAVTIPDGGAATCFFTNTAATPAATITKTTSGWTGTPIDGTFTFVLTRVVDQPAPVPAAAPLTVSLSTSGGTGTSDLPIELGVRYALTEVAPAGWSPGAITCELTDAAGSTTTVDPADFSVGPGGTLACRADNAAVPGRGTIEKNTYGQDALFSYQLDTVPSSGPQTVQVQTTGGIGSADLPSLVPGQVYSITETEMGNWVHRGITCELLPVTGAPVQVNPAGFVVTPGGVISCTSVNRLRPQIDKTVVSATATDATHWTIVYAITVTNRSLLEQFYTLDDTLTVPTGATLVSASATNDAGVDTGGWNGTSVTTLGTDVRMVAPDNINQPVVHTYTVTVNIALTGDFLPAAGVCTPSGGGILNTAVMTHEGRPFSDAACADVEVARLTLVKDVENAGVGSATADEWTLSATPADGAPPLSGNGQPTGGDQASIAGPVLPEVEYTLAESDGPEGYDPGTWTCIDNATGNPFTMTTTDSVTLPAGADVTCTITNTAEPVGAIVKEVVGGYPRQNADGTWSIEYNIVVTNLHAASAMPYDLVDELLFGAGITPTTASWTGPGGTSGTFDLSAGTATLATDGFVPAASSHTYRVSVTATVAASAATSETRLCSAADDERAFRNSALLTVRGEGFPADDCAEPSFPTVAKDGVNPATQNADASTNVVYTVTVANPGTTTAFATLTDTLPATQAGWTLASGVWNVVAASGAPEPTAASFAPGTVTLWSGSMPAGASYTYTISGVLHPTTASAVIGACGNGGGLINEATVTSGAIVEDDTGCVSIVSPPVGVVKGDGVAQQLADGTWQIDYLITVTNPGPAATVFTLVEAPNLGAGFTLVSAGWVGTAPATNAPIAGGASQSFTYRIVAAFDESVPDPELACVPGEAGAFHNEVTVFYAGGFASDDGCAEPASPAVTKTAATSTQDPVTGEWTLGYDVTVTNTTGIPLSYTVTDAPDPLPTGVTGGAWTATGPVVVGGGAGAVNPDWDGDTDTELATGLIPSGATHTFTITRTVSVAAAVPDDDLACGQRGDGAGIWNGAAVTNGVGGGEGEACAQIDRPDLLVEKTVSGVSQTADGTWHIEYALTVTNATALAGVYSLDDAIEFGGDIAVQDAAWTGPTSGSFTAPTWAAVLATDRVLAAGGVDTYTVTVSAIVDQDAWDGDALACDDGEPPAAGGFLNTVLLTVAGVGHAAADCAEPALPTIAKAGVSALQDPDDPSTWRVTYRLIVASGGFDTAYSLADRPDFAPGIDVLSGTAQRIDLDPAGPVLPVTPGVPFAVDVPLAAAETDAAAHEWTLTWVVDVTDAFDDADTECAGAGTAFFNAALLSVGDIDVDASACVPVAERVYPTIEKTVLSTTQDAASGRWTIRYQIDVTLPEAGAENPDNLRAEYDLVDRLVFGADIAIVSAEWTGNARNDVFEDGEAILADGRFIEAGALHRYNVTVVADVTAAAIDDGTVACLTGTAPAAGGFLNTAELSSGGQTTGVDACSEPAFPEVAKTAGTPVEGGDGTWTVSYRLTVRYPADPPAPAPAAIGYTLTDAPVLPDGVELVGDWTATPVGAAPLPDDADFDGEGVWTLVDAGILTADDPVHAFDVTARVRVTAAAAAGGLQTCDQQTGAVIRNVGTVTSGGFEADAAACQVVQLDDVGIVKTAELAGDETSVEAGDLFDYVLTVTNNGTRPATDVRVTDDDLHERLEIQSLTVSPGSLVWTQPGFSDNAVDTTIASLPVGGVAEIRVTVRFLPAAAPAATPHLAPGAPRPQPDDPIEQFDNTACVQTGADADATNDCADDTVPVRDLTGVVFTTCLSDAAQLGWTVRTSEALRSEAIDFAWTPDQAVATTDPASVNLSQAGGSVEWSSLIGWPGTAFTPGGIAIDYPGWRPIAASDIVPGSNPVNYFVPGTSTPMTDAQRAELVFNGLILDDSELDYAWRLPTTVAFAVNPELSFAATYPAVIPECEQARRSDVQVVKTPSVDRLAPGDGFAYTIEVANHSADSAAEAVVLTDVVPAGIRIEAVTWPGMGDASVFPNWQTCELTGQSASGYGGTLTCVLFGPLQPADANEGASAAPTLTLAARAHPDVGTSSLTNVAAVQFHTFGDPDDTGRDTDDAVVDVAVLPATGASPLTNLVFGGILALLAGAGLLLLRRRRTLRPRT